MEFIFLTCSDIHISDANPRARIDDYRSTILGKIEQVRMASNKLKADAVLIAGDLFNFKAPYKSSHALTHDLIEIFKKFKCDVYMIPGNHDLTGDSLASLPSQPLGVLFASGAVINLTHKVLTKEGSKISLVGVPYTDKLDLGKITMPDDGECLARICMMHLYAGPQSGNVFKERLYGYDELAKIAGDVFVLGHYHLDQGIQEINGQYFMNLGSVSRGTIHEENIHHEPKMGFIKITCEDGKRTIETMVIPLKIKPAEEVFDLKKKEEEQKEATEMQVFVEQLVQGTATMGSDKNLEEVIGKLKVEEEVRKMVLHFIHEASGVTK